MRRIAVVLVVALAAAVAVLTVAARRPASPPAAAPDSTAGVARELGIELRSVRVPSNGIALHVVEAGPASGPPVVLLHGYPEFWWGWHRQMAALAAAGFRAIVPDQRGYADSDKPPGVDAYRLDVLVADVVGLLDAYQIRNVDLAGHDWGGVVAWHVALQHPERVRRLAVFNAPHPLAWDDARAAGDTGGGSYRWLFALPWLPERLLRVGDWAPLVRSLRDSSRPGTFDDAAVARYRAAWSRDDAMRAMLDWYRAASRHLPRPAGDGTVTVPVQVVWGMQDRFFPARMGAWSVSHCRDGRLLEVPQAGHWLLHEEPVLTSEVLLEQLRNAPAPPRRTPASDGAGLRPAAPCRTCPHGRTVER